MDYNNVYVVDDDHDVCRSLSLFLTVKGFSVQSFTRSTDFLAASAGLAPGCVLLDVRMPEFDGFAVLSSLKEAKERLAIIVMTGHGDVATAVRAMRAGASDFIEKPFEEDLILRAIDRAAGSLDHKVKLSEHRARAISRLKTLTPRERDVLKGMVDGQSNKLLAHQLGVSVRTIEMHRSHIMDRLEAKSAAQVIRLAFDAGLIDRRADRELEPSVAVGV